MAVRTTVLGHGPSGPANTFNVAYTTPAGHTAILKDVRVVINSVTGVTRFVLALRSGGATTYLMDRTVAPGDILSITPWVVLEPGHQLVHFTNANDGAVTWYSGTELEGVA